MGMPAVYQHLLGLGRVHDVHEGHKNLRRIHTDKARLGLHAEPVAVFGGFVRAVCRRRRRRFLRLSFKTLGLTIMLEYARLFVKIINVENCFAVFVPRIN